MSTSQLPQQILSRIQSVIGNDKSVALHEPTFAGNEKKYLNECIDTGYVSSVGAFVNKFEANLAEYTGAKSAVACSNGTAALHIACLLAGVREHDEVLVQSLTFVASANAISYCFATPHFVDVDEKTLSVDPVALDKHLSKTTQQKNGECIDKATGKTIRALIVMHTFGSCADLDALKEICSKYKIVLIEDAAESLGSKYKGQHAGTIADISALSFNGNKIVTTGGGGALLFRSEELGKKAKHLTTTAKRPHPYEFFHESVGYNYRMPNINAALGCAQLEELPTFLSKKQALARSYNKAFDGLSDVRFFMPAEFCESNFWLNAVILNKPNLLVRNEILELTNKSGVMTRPVWVLMNKLPMYENCPSAELSVANSLEARIINLPSSPFLYRGLV